jgi:hypothetical protein
MMRPVDERLIPINGLIALLRGDGGWPALLRDQGFRRHQLEVPISTARGDIRADAVIYRRAPDLILLCEGKSGRNFEQEQARRYAVADLMSLRRTGAIPPELSHTDPVLVRALFVGREEHRAELEAGLRHLEIEAPLLTIGSARVRLSGSSGIPGLDDCDEAHSGGLPPARIPVDHQSPGQDLLEVLIPQVVAAQARNEDIVTVESLAASLLAEWSVLSHGGRESFVGRLAELLRGLAAGDMHGQFRYERMAQPHTRGRIVIQATPATRDPRGRTRAWQAQQRRAENALQRRSARAVAGQLSLDELADEGGLAAE